MASGAARAKRTRWADVVVLVAGVYAFAGSWMSSPEAMTGGSGDVASDSWLWIAYLAGGLGGIAAFFLAIKHPGAARGLAAAAGLVVLSGFAALREVSVLAILSLGLTGLALLAAAPLLGPMPTPEDEGEARRPLGAG